MLFDPTSHLGNFNVHLIWRTIGKKRKSDQKLTIKTGNFLKIMGIVTPNSNEVCGIPQETGIDQNNSTHSLTIVYMTRLKPRD